MRVDFQTNSSPYLGISATWCALVAFIFGAVTVISCWIRKCRNNLKFQYSALDPGMTATERTPRERATRERSYISCQEWTEKSAGRYEIMAHLEEIGCRPNKNWFLLSDTTVRTDRLMTLIPLPADCIALEELSPSDSPKGVLMELLGSLQHPYVYPVLDLGIFYSNQTHYACLVMPFNARGSLKDLIYKSQWNDPWNRKYTRKSTCLPLSQVQRLGRQILEALLFLRERGFPSHGHLHSGNVILQNGVARLSGLENGLLGLNSKVNAVVWATNIVDVENMDIICFGHLLFEMCTGYELPSPRPTAGHLQLDLERYPQVVEVLQMIFESPDNRYPTVEELVLCDLFRNIDLREMRGPSISSFKHGLSMSTLNLLNAVRRRQGASLNGSYSEGSSPCTPPSTPRRIGLRDVNSFDISSDSEDVLDEVVITASSSEFHQFHGFLHPSISSPIAFFDNSMHSMESMPSTSANVGGATTAPTTTSSLSISNEITNENLTIPCCSSVTISPSTFSNQLTTDLCTTSKNSKSRRMEYSMRGTKTCSSSSSCNPSQDSAFGSMTDGELSIASNSCRMSSFQSMSSPIDESVEDSITGLPGPSLTSSLSRASTTSNNESIDVPDYNPTQMAVASSASDFNLLKKKSASFGTTSSSGLPIEPPTILVNDGNSFYTTSPAKTFDTIQVFSQKYRVSSFEDMSMKRNFLRNVHKQNFRSLEEERRIDSAFTPVVKTMHSHHRSFDAGHRNINNSEKFKKLTHVSFASKISTTRERHTVWKNSILARKNNLIKSNESLHDYSGSSGSNSGSPKTAQQNECFYDTKLRKRVNSTNELCSTYRNDVEGRFSALTDDLKLFTQKSCSERYLLNMTMLRQTTISNDCDECDEDESNGAHRSENESCMDETCSNSSNSGYGHITLTNSSTNSKTENNSTDSSPSHRSMCKIIGGIESDNRHIEEKIPLLDGMEMSPISPVENNDML
ncbi:DEP domain-containing protein DDB_G0279099 isoform X3 [Contarinia nasturtii]|uniref:DEP domain-containing protein DDB_G0279099 isoform X3 n=1 Tax=Contarinia nasturtii TaxID=265458 RepID=UPI0012D3FB7F|nr:DEP domain-containing protein DDB_G0279099 isoform X3 [Contarinia nasturtii]XP_031616989.1 DEP domain-containing protein DDB_G0279099 isoform X3 [Contarinia nasturtii]XP_031616990.1 DEP domain-containing protein DDB_G0279099 isoform X3 [Contarinia nasturtii]XP_031616992.1 DEP domain-containing protein DDB_G0279099 isoform X3 [Contarinia nasturtii]XP_031616993.1 DEP domain-containing protein DDB_G0279099 isoform X3 [Contarinia nasturtii]XP_031616994.1 DEP domain-containing protein DDB_G02790